MALVTIDQIELPLKVSGSVVSISGSLEVTGSSTFIQIDSSSGAFAIASSGSVYIKDSIGTITGSLEGNPLDGGSF
jgi:hypothetical protein